MINSSGFPYNCGHKFMLMLLLSDEFLKHFLKKDWFLIEQYLKWLYPFPHLILVVTYFIACNFENVVCRLGFDKGTFGKGTFTLIPTWENFELTQWSSSNHFNISLFSSLTVSDFLLPLLVFLLSVSLFEMSFYSVYIRLTYYNLDTSS